MNKKLFEQLKKEFGFNEEFNKVIFYSPKDFNDDDDDVWMLESATTNGFVIIFRVNSKGQVYDTYQLQ